MTRRLPPLNALKAFEAAARLTSFSRAAAELNVTHAAISRHIRALEAEFRTLLFERTGRGVELTEAGIALSHDLTRAFDLVASAVSPFARPAKRRKRLTVTSDVSFAAFWLVPKLGAFTSRHPDIEIVVDPTSRLVDFAKEDVDFGIRFGRGGWPGLEEKLLAESELMLVGSPALLRANPLARPRDLDARRIIVETAKDAWNAWRLCAGLPADMTPSGPMLNGDLAVAAAEGGQGFAIADQIQAGAALIAGRLVSPFDVRASRGMGYYLVRRAGAKTKETAALFETWLDGELAAFSTALAYTAKPARTPRPRRASRLKATRASARSG
jgi:LysR family transcriptional regulator, glycine cleavage system transcriptional activator